jgi:hypothetical protein
MNPEPFHHPTRGDLVRLRDAYSEPRRDPPKVGALPVCKTLLIELIRNGKVKTVRLGKRSVFIPVDEIARLLSEGVQDA